MKACIKNEERMNGHMSAKSAEIASTFIGWSSHFCIYVSKLSPILQVPMGKQQMRKRKVNL